MTPSGRQPCTVGKCGTVPSIWYVGKQFFCYIHKAEAYAAQLATLKGSKAEQ